jgi:hypothetical protein
MIDLGSIRDKLAEAERLLKFAAPLLEQVEKEGRLEGDYWSGHLLSAQAKVRNLLAALRSLEEQERRVKEEEEHAGEVEMSFFAKKVFVLDGRAEYVRNDAEHAAIRLNGVWYDFAENPEDGYRSSLRRIVKLAVQPPNAVPFPKVWVAAWVDDEEDMLRLYEDGVEVGAFGTDQGDGYYPTFLGNLDISLLSFNRKK